MDPENAAICHCVDCQKLTGTAFRVTVFAPEANFRLTRGEPAIYVKTTAESGTPRAQAFCPTCGSHLYVTGVGEGPKLYGIRVGTADQRAELRPHKQIWHQSALDWLDTIGALPTKEKA